MFGTTLFIDYDTSRTIRELNNMKVEIINWFMNDYDSGVASLREYANDATIIKLLEMSFDEQTYILFVPIENDDNKRNQMRNIKLIDLL
jgi:hypothetical protein